MSATPSEASPIQYYTKESFTHSFKSITSYFQFVFVFALMSINRQVSSSIPQQKAASSIPIVMILTIFISITAQSISALLLMS